jgi:hypothetical protein
VKIQCAHIFFSYSFQIVHHVRINRKERKNREKVREEEANSRTVSPSVVLKTVGINSLGLQIIHEFGKLIG